jgi:hypothetical protein
MRLRLLLILFGAALVAASFTFPLWRPLFVSTIAEEAFPGLPANLQDAFAQLPSDQQAAFLSMAAENRDTAVAMAVAALQNPVVMLEEQPTPDGAITVQVARGEFARIDAVHWAQGTVTIFSFPDNRKVARLDDFQSANGPDLYVLLSASPAPRTQEEVELGDLDFELGRLKANIGNQNYEIPPEVDLSLYNSVVIYSKPFNVVFSTATI